MNEFIGFAIIGAAWSFAAARWPLVRVATWFIVGVALTTSSEFVNDPVAGSWWNTVAVLVGIVVGTILEREDGWRGIGT